MNKEDELIETKKIWWEGKIMGEIKVKIELENAVDKYLLSQKTKVLHFN